MIGGSVVVGALLLLLFASIFRINLTLDVAAVLWAVAFTLVALGIYQLISHWIRPKQTVSVGYHLKLEQPLVPVVGRYSFRLEVFYEIEEKGERSRVDQGSIELRFKKSDHPELLAWCCKQVSEHLSKHSRFAAERYPGARVLLPPDPTPMLLESEVGGGELLASALGDEASSPSIPPRPPSAS